MANELEAVPAFLMVFNTQYKCDLMSWCQAQDKT
jgi:hypothetical protein